MRPKRKHNGFQIKFFLQTHILEGKAQYFPRANQDRTTAQEVVTGFDVPQTATETEKRRNVSCCMLALSGELNNDMRGGARSSGKKVRGKFKKWAEPRRFFMTPRDLHEANSPLLRWQCLIPRICILLLPELDAAGEELAAL